MVDFPAAFDRPTFERMERNAQENTTQAAVYRRIALALLTQSSVELRAAVAEPETAEALLSTAEGLREAIEWHEAEIELLSSAEARILIALSDTYPEMVEERGLPPLAHSREEWAQLCESLTPEQVDAALAFLRDFFGTSPASDEENP
jgi:hypothetical protein